MRLNHRFNIIVTTLWAALAACAGCHAPPIDRDMNAQRRVLSLLMPSSIEVIGPFTRVKSFDDDATPDGIELLLRAVNALDNPGLMIVGDVRVELYEHVPASGDRKGRMLEEWRIALQTAEDQRMYWNQLTQMYEFRLGLDVSGMAEADKYVLLVTYTSPFGSHLIDEFILEYSGSRGFAVGSSR